MADVFLSYSRKDREFCETLGDWLNSVGYSAWWDRRLRPGRNWTDEIQRELDVAGCVIVIWSTRSVRSVHVQAEARFGLENRKLLPIVIDHATIPNSFNRVHTTRIPLIWNPGPSTSQILLKALKNITIPSIARVLVVEDDPDLNRQIVAALTDAGYSVDRAIDGEEGYFLGETESYDVIVLDIGLPKMNGISVLERWRQQNKMMHVIVLTARDRWSDKVAGMDAGADDYMAKPFHMEELLSRIRAQMRRSFADTHGVVECGRLHLDSRSAHVSCNGMPIKLTSHEYRLLAYLIHHNGRVVSRTELFEHLYDQDFDRDSKVIEVFIGRLRKKLPAGTIVNARGGYRLSRV